MTTGSSLPQLLVGTTVDVLRPVDGGETDSMGETVQSAERETVANVLFNPTFSEGVSGSTSMATVRADAEFHFPREYPRSLRGCSIVHDGHVYEVVGDIRRYTPENVPGQWNGVAQAREVS